MDRAPSTLENLQALELRVLEGPQAGACAPLLAGARCELAAAPHGLDESADIVLREEAGAPVRARVTADLSQALLEVLEGEVLLGDQALSAGARAPWAMHAPLKIGRSVVAFGRAQVVEWPCADAPTQPSTQAPPASRAAAGPSAAAAPARHRAEVWLATTGTVVLLACAGALFMAHVAAARQGQPAAGAAPLVTALRASEFAGLDGTERADGRVELRGRVGTLAQRKRLDSWLAAHQFTPAVAVQVDEAVARDVTEVFRVNGIAVQARVVGPGRVIAEASERDAEHLSRAEDAVRRDVRSLDQLTVHNTAVALPAPAPPVVDDPNKRIASVVPGDPAYIVTVDGARYFVGALLPSGHRITQVAAQRVTLERDGQQSTLNF